MSKTIQTIDLVRWSEPDEKHRVKELGMANAQEVFNKLEAHLKENNLLPDEYFLFEERDWKDKELPEQAEFICHPNYGGSEGIYLDISVLDENGNRTRYATGKTLQDDTEAFLQMSRIGAECSLMLNSYGNKIEIKETPEISYRLNHNEETVYTIIDRKGTDTLLRRYTLNPEMDPTPFIVANGVKIDNGIIEWDYGQYFKSLNQAALEFNAHKSEKDEVTEINSLLLKIQVRNNLYTNPYFFDYESVISALKEVQQTIENSLRCERPKNLPDSFIWDEKVSFGLDDDEFDPFVYDGSMSIEDFKKVQEAALAEIAAENNNIKEEKSMNAQIITIYQTEDKKHFSLRKIKNNGTYDETANCTSSLYELPKGFHTENILGIFEIADDKNHYFEVLNSNDKPVLIDLSAYEGKITKEYVEKVGIPLEKIQENTFRNIYEKNELSRISREEAEQLLASGIEVGYANSSPFYHGSEAGEYGWNRITSIEQLDKYLKTTDSLLTRISVHPNLALLKNPIYNEEYDMTIDTFRKYAQSMMYPDPTAIVMTTETELLAANAVNSGVDIYEVFEALHTHGDYEYDDNGQEIVRFYEAPKAKEALGKLEANNVKLQKQRIFVDMDGTLAVFNKLDTIEPLFEKGYFENLKPQQNVVDAVKEIINSHPEKEVFILSAYLSDSKFALEEKNAWLNKYLPEIDEKHRIFCPCGEDKKNFIPGEIKPDDFLLDDYTNNLLLWQPPAKGIKLLNGINHTNGTWKHDCIDYSKNAQILSQTIIDIMNDDVKSVISDRDNDGIVDKIDSTYNPPEIYPEERFGQEIPSEEKYFYAEITPVQLEKLFEAKIQFASRPIEGKCIVRLARSDAEKVEQLLGNNQNNRTL